MSKGSLVKEGLLQTSSLDYPVCPQNGRVVKWHWETKIQTVLVEFELAKTSQGHQVFSFLPGAVAFLQRYT